MSALTTLVLRHRLVVVLLWLLLAACGAATVATTSSRLSQSFAQPGSAGRQAADRIVERYGTDPGAPPLVVVLTPPAGSSVLTPSVGAQLADTLAAAGRFRARVVDYPGTGDRALVTGGGRSSYALVYLPPVAGESNPAAGPVLAAIGAAAPPGWSVTSTGIGPLRATASPPDGPGILLETIIAGAGALAVLVFVFASFVALLPLVMAAVSILVSFLLLLGLTVLTEVNFVAQFIIGLIGLGVAIDYSLLVVTRWREERSRGAGNREAVHTAMQHAGRAVVFSGLTVAIGLLALVLLPMPAMRSFGYAGALIPLVSVAVAATLLPVLLDVAGPALDRRRLRGDRSAGRGWTAWARLVVRYRWPAAAAGLLALGLLGAPALHLQLGDTRAVALAQTGPAVRALDELRGAGVPTGVLTPMQVLVQRGGRDAVVQRLRATEGVHAVLAPERDAAAGTALVTVLPVAEGGGSAGQDTVARVRAALSGDRDVLGIAGPGTTQADFRHAVYGTFPLMLALVSLLTFLLLARAFRSLVLPAKAVLLNVVSLAAAYGVLVLVWQDGYGSQLIWSTPGTGSVAIWVPIIVFAFLFGLSMDYEVFLLARMKEAHDSGAGTDEAVVTGLSRTGRLVTCAALILAFAFVSMSTAPATDVRVLATGLGAGIVVDATIVRCLLVPSLVSLFGSWNWWLPGRSRPLPAVVPQRRAEPQPQGSAGL